jgi:segregation and condensation protein B
MNLKSQIEALLFASDQPLTLARLQEVLPGVERSDLTSALKELEQDWEQQERAIQLQRVAGGFQLTTRQEYVDIVRRLFVGKRRVRLTKAALEALAIIAYKQPATRPEIDAIRGVSSGGVVETLLERNLVRIAGRADSVGRPLLYATTTEFLQYLGLDGLKDLPSLEELETMLAEREEEARRQEEDEMRELAEATPPESSEEVPRPAAARLEDKLRSRNLPTLDELDAELRARGQEVDTLSAQVAAERRATMPEGASQPAARPDADPREERPIHEPEGAEPEDEPAVKETGADGP